MFEIKLFLSLSNSSVKFRSKVFLSWEKFSLSQEENISNSFFLSFHSVHYVFFKVLTRKGQLEELYVDNQELEGKRREVEAWLARMEAWQDRMQPVAPDLLESQVRENKVNWINTLNMKTCWGLEILCMQNLSSKFLFKESFTV